MRQPWLSQGRVFDAGDFVGGNQQVLQRAVTVLEQRKATVQVYGQARGRIVLLLLVRDALLADDLPQGVGVASPLQGCKHQRATEQTTREGENSTAPHA